MTCLVKESHMIFEGSEKKLEFSVSSRVGDLREFGIEFWREVVEAAHAKILSSISSPELDAYLLSESSLFVWRDRVTMITCGRTALVDAIDVLVDRIGADQIQSLIYERKNEYFPHDQLTDFYDDAKKLSEIFEGKSFRFGDADTHHLFLFVTEKPYTPLPADRTLEILMYDLRGSAQEIFRKESVEKLKLREHASFQSLLEGFQIDDFGFEPFGYSLNAVRGSEYYTIHITPQELGSYVSFETNIANAELYERIVQRAIELFNPRSFDIVCFDPKNYFNLSFPAYMRESLVQEEMSCGYQVSFSHYYQPLEGIGRAYPILLNEV